NLAFAPDMAADMHIPVKVCSSTSKDFTWPAYRVRIGNQGGFLGQPVLAQIALSCKRGEQCGMPAARQHVAFLEHGWIAIKNGSNSPHQRQGAHVITMHATSHQRTNHMIDHGAAFTRHKGDAAPVAYRAVAAYSFIFSSTCANRSFPK